MREIRSERKKKKSRQTEQKKLFCFKWMSSVRLFWIYLKYGKTKKKIVLG